MTPVYYRLCLHYYFILSIRFQQYLPVTLICTKYSLLQQQVVRRRTSDVPMAFSVYVIVLDVTAYLTAPTLQMNSTAVSRQLILTKKTILHQ